MARGNGKAGGKGGRKPKTVKDYQRGKAADDYDVAVGEDGKGHNSKHFAPDSAELQDFRDLLIDEWTNIKTIMDQARLKCEPSRAAIKAAKKLLVESGYHSDELNTLMRKFRLEDKLDHVADNLDDEQKLHYDSLVKALGDFGDTALGQAALGQAGPAGAEA